MDSNALQIMDCYTATFICGFFQPTVISVPFGVTPLLMNEIKHQTMGWNVCITG